MKSESRFRGFAAAVAVALTSVSLVACGAADAQAAESGAARDGAFPVTIEHAFGSTTVESEPTRIVTVGYNDEQALLALGIKPVGTVNQYPGEPDVNRTWPWVVGPWDGTEPVVVGSNPEDTISFEKIAALEPDLILGLYSGIDEEFYEKLATIAPTVVKNADYDDYATPWQITTETAATAVGREADGEKLVADVEAKFEQVRADHPEFANQKALMITGDATPEFYAFSSEDTRAGF